MTDLQLLDALRRLKVETGSLACFGCGYEHDCTMQGCRIIREASARIQEGMWRSADGEPPKPNTDVKVIVNGNYGGMYFVDAVELATYDPSDGWILEAYPEWETPEVSYWAPLKKRPWED